VQVCRRRVVEVLNFLDRRYAVQRCSGAAVERLFVVQAGMHKLKFSGKGCIEFLIAVHAGRSPAYTRR
jgi:hypothetical protein